MEIETRFTNNALRINHADQTQSQNLPVNKENQNQIPKPRQQQHGDPHQDLHTEPKNLGRHLDCRSARKKIVRLLRDQNKRRSLDTQIQKQNGDRAS
jgi:hypothetical protein